MKNEIVYKCIGYTIPASTMLYNRIIHIGTVNSIWERAKVFQYPILLFFLNQNTHLRLWPWKVYYLQNVVPGAHPS